MPKSLYQITYCYAKFHTKRKENKKQLHIGMMKIKSCLSLCTCLIQSKSSKLNTRASYLGFLCAMTTAQDEFFHSTPLQRHGYQYDPLWVNPECAESVLRNLYMISILKRRRLWESIIEKYRDTHMLYTRYHGCGRFAAPWAITPAATKLASDILVIVCRYITVPFLPEAKSLYDQFLRTHEFRSAIIWLS